MIELSRSQDEETGDGTTSVIVLAGEMLTVAEPFLASDQMHPTQIVHAYYKALDSALAVCDRLAKPFDFEEPEALRDVVRSCVGTKFVGRWGDLVVSMAMQAVTQIAEKRPLGG